METFEYIDKFKIENEYWWNVSQREVIKNIVLDKKKDRKINIIDIGCGSGKMLEDMIKEGYENIIGIDINDTALNCCKQRKLNNLIKGDINCLPLKTESIDIIISIDSIYHRWVKNDSEVFRQIHRCLKNNGLLIIHLPALNSLFNQHDIITMAKKRYNRNDILKLSNENGFEVIKINYRNFILFPLALIIKIFGKYKKNNFKSEQVKINIIFNTILLYILKLENKIGKYIKYPVGTAIYAILRKC